jgi:iron(III) transport system substrate-binding protein
MAMRSLGGGLLAMLLVSVIACASGPQAATGAAAGGAGAPLGENRPSASTAAPAAFGDRPGGDWEATVAAARAEGRVVVTGPTGEAYRTALTSFEQDYPEIKIDYSGFSPQSFWPRFYRERESGQFLWDVRANGADIEAYRSRDLGLIEPLRPVLLLPEILDDSRWLGGLDGIFADKGREFAIAYFATSSPSLFVNRDFVSEAELRSAKELVDPRLKGKIAVYDPRGSAGLGQMTVLLAAYGEEFVADLLTKQEVTVAQEPRQLAEWVVRGRYPVAIGLAAYNLVAFREQGLGLNVRVLAAPAELSSAGGGLQLINRAPHPNAARVFVNWLLSQQTQQRISQTTGYNSRRLDVPPANPAGVVDPARLSEYIFHQSEAMLPTRTRALELATTLLP